jgi:hypothetical protein
VVFILRAMNWMNFEGSQKSEVRMKNNVEQVLNLFHSGDFRILNSFGVHQCSRPDVSGRDAISVISGQSRFSGIRDINQPL